MKRVLFVLMLFVVTTAFSACSDSSGLSDDYQNNLRYRREVNEMSQRTGESPEDIDSEIQRAITSAGWDF